MECLGEDKASILLHLINISCHGPICLLLQHDTVHVGLILPNCSGHPFIEEAFHVQIRTPNPKAWIEGTAGWSKSLACGGASDEGNPQNQSVESCPVAAINPGAASSHHVQPSSSESPCTSAPSLFSLQTLSLSVLYKDTLSSQHSCWLEHQVSITPQKTSDSLEVLPQIFRVPFSHMIITSIQSCVITSSMPALPVTLMRPQREESHLVHTRPGTEAVVHKCCWLTRGLTPPLMSGPDKHSVGVCCSVLS